MKKKAFLIFAAMLVGGLLGGIVLSGDTFADVNCVMSGSGAESKDLCAGKLYRGVSSIGDTCKRSEAANDCKSKIKNHLSCGPGGTCTETAKNAYASDVLSIISSRDVDPCSSGDTACKKKSANWKYYYNTDPNKGSDTTDADKDSSKKKDDDSDTDSDTDSDSSSPTSTTLQTQDSGSCTSILPDSWCSNDSVDGIFEVIKLAIAIITGAVVVAGTVGIIYCGFLWMSAKDNEAQIATAKKRLLDIVIGIAAWSLFALLANLFIPKTSADIETDLGSVEATKTERNIG